jgi:hypothetical protein
VLARWPEKNDEGNAPTRRHATKGAIHQAVGSSPTPDEKPRRNRPPIKCELVKAVLRDMYPNGPTGDIDPKVIARKVKDHPLNVGKESVSGATVRRALVGLSWRGWDRIKQLQK